MTKSIEDKILSARRGSGAIVSVVDQTFQHAHKAAQHFGLSGDARVYFEVPYQQALETLAALLHKDMAYRGKVMSSTKARNLATHFLEAFPTCDSRFFTNADWHEWLHGKTASMMGSPATDHTFDGGILVLSPSKTGCAWFMDED